VGACGPRDDPTVDFAGRIELLVIRPAFQVRGTRFAGRIARLSMDPAELAHAAHSRAAMDFAPSRPR
jgi:hypothetical protein